MISWKIISSSCTKSVMTIFLGTGLAAEDVVKEWGVEVLASKLSDLLLGVCDPWWTRMQIAREHTITKIDTTRSILFITSHNTKCSMQGV